MPAAPGTGWETAVGAGARHMLCLQHDRRRALLSEGSLLLYHAHACNTGMADANCPARTHASCIMTGRVAVNHEAERMLVQEHKGDSKRGKLHPAKLHVHMMHTRCMCFVYLSCSALPDA